MKRIMAALLLVLLGHPAFAATAILPPPLPPGAILRGHFAQDRMTPGFTAPLHSEGDFVVSPARGVIWHTRRPFDTAMIVTPAGIAQDVAGERTMSLTAARVPFLAHLYGVIGGVMAGDRQALDSDFIVTATGDAGHWHLRAVPRRQSDPSMPFTAIAVSGGRLVERVVLSRADGGADTIVFLDQLVAEGPPSPQEDAAFDSAGP